MFTIGVFGLILNKNNKILLCHRTDKDLWNLPGGRLESRETPWQGVTREVKEETGLEVEVEKLTGIYSKPHKDEIVFQFLCKVISGEIILNKEADQIKYFNLKDIPQNTVHKQVERIKEFLNNSDKVYLSKQTGNSAQDFLKS